MPNQLTDIEVNMISLVKAAANGKQVILKFNSQKQDSDAQFSKSIDFKKFSATEGIVYGIVYAPNETDSQGDCASESEIKKAAYNFMKSLNLKNIDVGHDGKTQPAFVAESWILKSGDPIFPDEKPGAWAVAIKLEDEGLKEAVVKGEITGLSMAGFAKRTPLQKEAKMFSQISGAMDMWKYSDALRESIESILCDTDVADKAATISATIDEFKQTITGRLSQSQPPQEGDQIMANTVTKAIPPVAPPAPAATPPKPDQKQESGGDMQKQIDGIMERLDEITKQNDDLTKRVEALEAALKVSKQRTEPMQKQDDYANLGSQIASHIKR